METKQNIIIGIDISKASLDICKLTQGKEKHFVIDNTLTAIKKFIAKLKTSENVIIGMENTGRYNWALYEVLGKKEITTHVIPPLHLKKSMGLVRGKNDKIDAIRIARFTQKHHDELDTWEAPREQIKTLKVLLTERNYRIKTKRQLLNMKHDYTLMKTIGLDKSLMKMNKQLIAEIDSQIKRLELQIESLIQTDEQLNKQAKLMRSVPGVGKVLCWYMLAKTNEFKSITDPRKMACYAGVVPFDFQSGTSIKRKQRVSFYSDKTIKSLLHMGAMSAIRLNNDLRVYYLKKVKEGKNKMSVLNAVRNKIIHRIYAVLKNQNNYQNYLVLS